MNDPIENIIIKAFQETRRNNLSWETIEVDKKLHTEFNTINSNGEVIKHDLTLLRTYNSAFFPMDDVSGCVPDIGENWVSYFLNVDSELRNDACPEVELLGKYLFCDDINDESLTYNRIEDVRYTPPKSSFRKLVDNITKRIYKQ